MKNSLVIILFVAATFAHAQTYPVIWTNPVNITVNGNNSLTKTGAPTIWDAGAVSQNVLLSGQDGFVEFIFAGGVSNNYMISLSRLNNSVSYLLNDYAVYVNGSTLTVYNAGAVLGSHGTLVTGDVLRIGREANTVKVYKNTVLQRTINLSANTDHLRVDAVIGTGSAPAAIVSFVAPLTVKPTFSYPTIANNDGGISLQLEGQVNPVTYLWASGETTPSITGKARGQYSVTVTDGLSRNVSYTYKLGYPIEWTNLTNVTINGDNSLTKSDADGWTSGASSLNLLPASTDGWIEYVAKESPSHAVIGLSRLDKDVNYLSIGYGWMVANTGIIYIFEAGVSRGAFGSLLKGDVLRIAREAGNINYYLNGTLKRTIAFSTSYVAVADVSIWENKGPIPVISASFEKQIKLSPSITLPTAANNNGGIALNIQGTYTPHSILWSSGETSNIISGKPRNSYTVTVTDAASRVLARTYRVGYPVAWTDLQNSTLNANNTIYKSVGDANGQWDASAISANFLPPSTDGWIEFHSPSPNSRIMVGLGRLNTTASYSAIDYCFLTLEWTADIYIYELGTNLGIVASQTEGAVYTIAREGSNIKYYINGVVVRTVATTPTFQLYTDVSIERGSIPQISASFDNRPPSTYYAIANGSWISPAVWSLTEGGPAAINYPGPMDIANIKGYTVTVSTGIYSGGTNVTVTNENTCLKVDGAMGKFYVKGNVVVKGESNATTVKGLVVQNSAKIDVLNP